MLSGASNAHLPISMFLVNEALRSSQSRNLKRLTVDQKKAAPIIGAFEYPTISRRATLEICVLQGRECSEIKHLTDVTYKVSGQNRISKENIVRLYWLVSHGVFRSTISTLLGRRG